MRRLRQDQGLVLVLVAVLLVVLLGMAALAVDLGSLYSERRQLRNGADAAALAIAEDCAWHPGSCTQQAAATAQMYADANSDDGASAAQVTFPDSGKVRVVTSAFDAEAGAPGVRVPLMSLFGLDRVNVTAAATAEWGYPASGWVLPLVVDATQYVAVGHTFLYPGWRLPQPGESDCWATLTVGPSMPGDTEPECLARELELSRNRGEDVLIPLYSGLDPQGKYLVKGFAFFHLTGYQLADQASPGFSCGAEEPGFVCLGGYFTTRTIYSGDPDGRDYGVVLVKLIG
jgi:Flp pilus assembly protein TadG